MNVKLELQPTDRTDILCIGCNRMHADLVIVTSEGASEFYGMHKKCAKTIHVKRSRRAA